MMQKRIFIFFLFVSLLFRMFKTGMTCIDDYKERCLTPPLKQVMILWFNRSKVSSVESNSIFQNAHRRLNKVLLELGTRSLSSAMIPSFKLVNNFFFFYLTYAKKYENCITSTLLKKKISSSWFQSSFSINPVLKVLPPTGNTAPIISRYCTQKKTP